MRNHKLTAAVILCALGAYLFTSNDEYLAFVGAVLMVVCGAAIAFRGPDKVIGTDYLSRWHIIPRNPWFNIYLHKFTGSDDDRACHDHPWNSVSFLLKGEAIEIHEFPFPDRRLFTRLPVPRFKPMFRPAEYIHRMIVVDGPVWTLFITGRRRRVWGFYCPKGWVYWKKFTDTTGLKRGAGCGES